MALSKEQKQFIRAKVKKLGTPERVKLFYKRNDLVSEFARHLAESLLKKKSHRKIQC